VIYVPTYDPAYIWGPPVYGFYPPLFYPGIDVGFGFFPGISIGAYFGGFGIYGGLGWGWGPNWFGGGLFINNSFFHRYGFREYHGFGAGGAWAHDPGHRLGVPYANRDVANRFHAGGDFRGAARGNAGESRGNAGARNLGGVERSSSGARFGSPGFEQRNSGGNHSAFGGIQNGGETRMQSDHGFSSMHGGFSGGGGGGFRGGGGGGSRGGGGGRR